MPARISLPRPMRLPAARNVAPVQRRAPADPVVELGPNDSFRFPSGLEVHAGELDFDVYAQQFFQRLTFTWHPSLVERLGPEVKVKVEGKLLGRWLHANSHRWVEPWRLAELQASYRVEHKSRKQKPVLVRLELPDGTRHAVRLKLPPQS